MPLTVVPNNTNPALNVATDKVTFVIVKAREYDAKEELSDPDPGSNPADDRDIDVLQPGDATRQELVDAIRSLKEQEQIELVALAWLGRGTYDISDWDSAVEMARSEHKTGAAEYLVGLPLLGDYLEEGLAQFGIDISDDDEIG